MSDRAKTSADAPAPAGAAGASGEARGGTTGVDEFAHIPSPRTRHPLLAAAAAALAFFLVFHIRAELRYALSPADPLDLGDARVAFSNPTVVAADAENRFVRVRGTPDRESGLELDTKGSWVFSQFFRVLGTGDRLFVHRRENPLPAFRAEKDAFEGRLIRFRDLSFESSIRTYFMNHVTATHFFAVDDLARALAAQPGGTLALRDRAGDAVTLGPGAELALDVSRPDEVRIGLRRERFPDEASARAAIERQGAQVVGAGVMVKDELPASSPASAPGPLALVSTTAPVERWTFVARVPPEKRDAALSALEAQDPKVAIRDARQTFRARLADIQSRDGALWVKGAGAAAPRQLPLASIATARTTATVEIPGDAFLVVEADGPREHLPTVLMALLLVMFGVVNVVALVRELRRR